MCVHSKDKRIRASAIAVLSKHGGREARYWLEQGIKAKEVCVRLATAVLLPELDQCEYPDLFVLAQHDSNPEIRRFASKVSRIKSGRS
jgi:HEAT repeat protein